VLNMVKTGRSDVDDYGYYGEDRVPDSPSELPTKDAVTV
jgi:hypothetical protein